MTVITKVNPIQTGPFQGSRKLTVESFMVVPKNFMVVLGKTFEIYWNWAPVQSNFIDVSNYYRKFLKLPKFSNIKQL